MILILKYGIFQIYIFCIYIIVEFFYFFFPEVRMECFRKKLWNSGKRIGLRVPTMPLLV